MKIIQKKADAVDLVGKPFKTDIYEKNGNFYELSDIGTFCRVVLVNGVYKFYGA